jgi:Lrp/AsnC family transcriptional regulator, leucine-responsive regulatory protein
MPRKLKPPMTRAVPERTHPPISSRLDEIDVKILRSLQEHGRISNVELADQVGLSPAPCLRRVRALEEAGVVRRYVGLVNPAAVDLNVTVFVQITLDLQLEGRLEIFEQAIMRRPEVLECYLMTGDADYLLRVVVPDVSAYERFLRDSLTRIESAAGIKSSFALKQVKYSTALPIADSLAHQGVIPEPPAPRPAQKTRRPKTKRDAARS